MVIELENWKPEKNYSTTGLTDEYMDILGISVIKSTVPVRPGRNLSIIIETAAITNRQKKMGYVAAQELMQSLGMDGFEPIKQEIEVWDNNHDELEYI